MYQSEKVLTDFSERFVPRLQEQHIPASIEMYRDYMVKIGIGDAGFLKVYHSPKKGLFRLDLSELKNAYYARDLQEIFEEVTGSKGRNVEAKPKVTIQIPPDYSAFVDGSFIDGRVGWGAVILHNARTVEKLKGGAKMPEARQVGGELTATIRVLEWCTHHHVDAITIFYDYEGIEKWATGEWRATKPLTQRYQERLKEFDIHITWQKVPAHSGIKWNELADKLAKQGAQEN